MFHQLVSKVFLKSFYRSDKGNNITADIQIHQKKTCEQYYLSLNAISHNYLSSLNEFLEKLRW